MCFDQGPASLSGEVIPIYVCIIKIQDHFLTPGDNSDFICRFPSRSPYGCFVCGKRFGKSLSLLDHMKSTHFRAEKPARQKGEYACDLCSSAFSTAMALEAHKKMKRHIKCGHCNLLFKNPRDTEQHLKFVEFVAPFHAETPRSDLERLLLRGRTRRFVLKVQHNWLMRKYRGRNRPRKYGFWFRFRFPCRKCYRGFSDEKHLLQHYKQFKHYTCQMCEKRFHTIKQRARHFRVSHPAQYQDRLAAWKQANSSKLLKKERRETIRVAKRDKVTENSSHNLFEDV